MQERFLPYLPQDNAGLADAQAELVCEIINDEIAELLSHPASELWNAVANDNSLIACLDTYLRYSRWAIHYQYDNVDANLLLLLTSILLTQASV